MHTKVEFRVAHFFTMYSPADFRVSGLEVGDPLTSYLGSGLEVRIALILYNYRLPAAAEHYVAIVFLLQDFSVRATWYWSILWRSRDRFLYHAATGMDRRSDALKAPTWIWAVYTSTKRCQQVGAMGMWQPAASKVVLVAFCMAR